MKKVSIFILALLGFVMSNAQQHESLSFFDQMGIVRLETQELNESTDTIVTLFHRSDDVVWSVVVYRVIDMRMKQNYQLYTPVVADDPVYASLFMTMVKAIADGMPIYEKSSTIGDIRPYFNKEAVAREDVPTLLNYDRDGTMGDGDVATSEYMLLNYVNDSLKFNPYSYENFAKNTLKYMVQEVVFFNKNYSRLYTKILAIAPMNADNAPLYEDMPVMEALYGQILFWVPFDSFRPYMARQYVTPRGSDTKRITFDDFFGQKMYTSYLVGKNNVYSRMIPEIATTYEDMQKEQKLIEAELLNLEQDLWEY